MKVHVDDFGARSYSQISAMRESRRTEFCDTRGHARSGRPLKSRWLYFHELCKMSEILNFRKFFGDAHSIPPPVRAQGGRGGLAGERETTGERARRSGSFTPDRGGSKERRRRVGNNQRGRDDGGDGRGAEGEGGSFLRGW